MDAKPPSDPDFWKWAGYYLLAILVGCIGSFAGLLVEQRDGKSKLNRNAAITYLFLGAVTGAFAALVLFDTAGASPLMLGVIGFASFKAVDVLASVSLAAGAIIERVLGPRR
jgi:hypothetical protein